MSSTVKVSKFADRLNTRIQELEEIEEANEGCNPNTVNQVKAEGDVEMGPDEPQKDKMQDDFDLLELSKYWDEDVVDVIVDRGTNDDRELLEMQQIWQLVIAKESSSVHLEGSA